MGEEAGHRKCTTPLQAGPAEVEREALSSIDTRATHLIGQQLAQIGDEMDYKWRQQNPVLQWQALNFWIRPYVQTRRAFSGIVCNIWGSKIMAMLMVRAWMVPQLQNGCQEARKWATWVWSLQLRELSRRRTCTLASSLLLLSISLLLLTRG